MKGGLSETFSEGTNVAFFSLKSIFWQEIDITPTVIGTINVELYHKGDPYDLLILTNS